MHSTVTTLPRHQMLIDGELVASQKTIAVVNPTTEEVISEVPSGTLEDVNAAVLAAEKAQKSWSQLPAIERAHYLREIAQGYPRRSRAPGARNYRRARKDLVAGTGGS